MAFLGQEEQIREFQNRFKYIYAVLFIGLGLVTSRLIYLQVLKGDQMRNFSEENRIKRVKIASPRGMIFDRNRTLLIDNRPDFDVEVIPQYLKESKQGPAVIAMLSKIIQVPEKEIYKELLKAKNQAAFLPIKIKTDLSRDEVAQIEVKKLDMPGVEVKQEIKRTNIYGDIAAHLLGYISEINASELPLFNKKEKRYRLGDNIGRFGLEQRLEDVLRGEDGEEIKEVDALGRVKLEKKRNRVLQDNLGKKAVPGKNLILTLDQELQQVATQAFGEKIGSLVAIDPRSGEVLAMISRPSFNPTSFSRGVSLQIWNQLLNNENHPLRDKTVQDHYSPGSVFKIVTAIAALEEGVIDENTTFHCTGKIKIGNRIYHCHSKQGHGDVNLSRAITRSCDIFLYRIAQKLKSVDDIAKWAKTLGLGKKTGINLAGEVPGLIPTEQWKMKRYGQAWNAGETASVAIGQSFVLVTTLQLANLYGSIGNGGILYKPNIVKRIETADGDLVQEFQPEILSKMSLGHKTVSLIKRSLYEVVNSPTGTVYRYRLPGMDVAGKTGTVQLFRLSADRIYSRCENMKFQDRHHGLFSAFAPVENPVIAVAVVSEHTCHGSSGAAPIAQAVIQRYLEKYFPEKYSKAALAKAGKKNESKFKIQDSSPEESIEDDTPAQEPAPLSPQPNKTPTRAALHSSRLKKPMENIL